MDRVNLGPDARIAVIGDSSDVLVLLQAGRRKLALQLAPPTAARLNAELDRVTDAGHAETNRPRPPSRHVCHPWRNLVARIEAGRPTPADGAAVRELLTYLGVNLA